MTRRLPRSLPRLAAISGLLAAAACAPATPPPGGPVSVPIQPSITVPIAPPPSSGNARFDAFLINARNEAIQQGIRPEVYDQATRGIAPIASIAASNANQPEFSRPVWAYLDSAVSARRVKDAQVMLARYVTVLDQIAAQYGVPKQILVAIWGMESDFGADAGGVNLFAALATLAYDGPRMSYARPEFFAALRLYQERRYPLSEMVGSWAGAFGQTQFTPTTFFKYAADGDGDGVIDLWRSAPDALASAARLLSSQGWRSGESWGYEVRLPKGFPYEEADTDTQKSFRDWRALGVKTVDGDPLPVSDAPAAIYLPAGAHGPAFLLFPNFNVILKYNNAASYALAVALLGDRMMGAGGVRHSWPREERSLSRDERMRFQSDLNAQGFDVGTPDGVLGRKTRNALRQYQKSHGLAADGFATAAMLEKLDSGR